MQSITKPSNKVNGNTKISTTIMAINQKVLEWGFHVLVTL